MCERLRTCVLSATPSRGRLHSGLGTLRKVLYRLRPLSLKYRLRHSFVHRQIRTSKDAPQTKHKCDPRRPHVTHTTVQRGRSASTLQRGRRRETAAPYIASALAFSSCAPLRSSARERRGPHARRRRRRRATRLLHASSQSAVRCSFLWRSHAARGATRGAGAG